MINIRRTTIMKKGTLLVVRKPYQGDTVIQNTLNYAIGSLFADEEDILTSHIDNEDDSDQIIEEYYRLQAPYNMTDHRRMFHFILTTRTSKSMCTILKKVLMLYRTISHPLDIRLSWFCIPAVTMMR